ncbi:MAG: hypothetical protein Q9191_003648 [Dirinaria sp. TL-2023a]
MASSQDINIRGGDTDVQTEGTEYRAVYPPELESVDDLGYVSDTNKRGYSRDIGRSVIIGGRYYYIYGDTFCKDENGVFRGIQSTSYAITSKDEPLKSHYLKIDPDGMVEPLIPLDREEQDIQATKLPRREIFRVKLWCFGGIVETSPGVGWLWFEKSVYRGDNEVKYYGVCVARVSVEQSSGRLNVVRITGSILQNPGADDMIFFEHEPRIGAFSTLVEGNFIYLWGTHKQAVVLARVPLNSPHVRNEYRYWDGFEYVEDIERVKPFMRGMQQGAIFKSSLFGRDKPWVAVGCTCWKDSQVMLGAAESLEGPWHLTHIYHAFGKEAGGNRYCIYPHPWIFEAEKGQLAISWSEHWPGNVIMTRFNFAMRTFPTEALSEGEDEVDVATMKTIVENRMQEKKREEEAAAEAAEAEERRKKEKRKNSVSNSQRPTKASDSLKSFEMANYLASIFGTEQDKVNCSFYYKIGACRHGDRCSRKHVKPSYSQTILLPNLYQNPAYDPKNKMNPSQLQNHFDAFYEDFWCEMCKYGEPEEVVVCDNNNDHLIGNVYARFKYEDSAQAACDALNSRWYAARPIYCELSPVTDFREACCRLNSGEGCVRAGFCNFIHRKEPSPELERELELGTKKWLRERGRDERSMSRSPSPEPTRKRY